MINNYHISLDEISLDEYQKILESKELLPARKILKNNISERFEIIRSIGVKNLEELLGYLKNKKKIEDFKNKTGIPNDYLLILKREINSYLPNPVHLAKFPGINQRYIAKLADMNIKNSKQIITEVTDHKELSKLSKKSNIPPNDLLEILRLSDLVRINGVGPVFARMMLDNGTDTSEKVANSNPKHLFEELNKLNKERNYTKAKFTPNDVSYCINFAKKLPIILNIKEESLNQT
jgi:Domain of unknown function (DUF4332)